MSVMTAIPTLSVLALLAGGFGALLAGQKRNKTGDFVTLAAAVAALLLLLCLIPPVLLRGGVLTRWLGGWLPREDRAMGVSLTADGLSLFFALLLCGGTVLSRVHALTEPREDRAGACGGLSLLLSASALTAVLSGECSTLFVSMELMGLAAAALIACARNRPGTLEGAFRFLAVEAVTAAALLFGAGLLWSQVNTLNLAQIAARIPAEGDNLTLSLAFGLLFSAFAARALLVPFHVVSVDVLDAVPPSAARLLSGTLSKCGVYCMIRLIYVIFQNADQRPVSWLVTGFGAASMFLCALMAFRQRTLRRVLSFHAAAQTGRAVMLAGLCTALGLGAGLYQMLHAALALSLLFLAAGLVERQTGTGDLRRLDGPGRGMPRTAALFLTGVLSLCGLPPFAGFQSQWLTVQALWQSGAGKRSVFCSLVLVLTLLSGVLTIVSLFQTAARVCFGPGAGAGAAPEDPPRRVRIPLWLLSAGLLLTGLFPRFVLARLVTPAVSATANIPAYVDASLGEGYAWSRGVPGGAVAWFPTAHPWSVFAWLVLALTLLCAGFLLALLYTARRKRLSRSTRRFLRALVKRYPLLAALFLLCSRLADSRLWQYLHGLWDRMNRLFRSAHSGGASDACLYALTATAFVLAVCLAAM